MEYIFSDVNEAFPVMWHRLLGDDGVIEEQTRNGPVRRSVYPVTTIFKNPYHRVLFDKVRDANPFFHLFESIWMLAGRNEVAWLAKFNKRMMEYSDDGITLVSSYGYRWSGVLPTIISRLQKDPQTRRAYIPIFWGVDVPREGKDVPCNTGISFYLRNDCLDMTVFNRSNDMVYGAYGANVVHFSFLQEYVAAAVGCDIGFYAQISSNFHLYTDFDVTKRLMGKVQPRPQNLYYEDPYVNASPHWVLRSREDIDNWQEDAKYFIDVYTEATDPGDMEREWRTPFFAFIAAPMYRGWHAYVRERDVAKAVVRLEDVEATDWRFAGQQWINNRLEARSRAKASETHQV